ncbi:hypothetical protein ACFO5Q_00505 [Kordiimonas lipolytica]|uniref:Uncharacterized protein n=1 Tax=Kordiimonas lipolytica TaxID=1662421 RepID=A0ABV8U547_9PROT
MTPELGPEKGLKYPRRCLKLWLTVGSRHHIWQKSPVGALPNFPVPARDLLSVAAEGRALEPHAVQEAAEAEFRHALQAGALHSLALRLGGGTSVSLPRHTPSLAALGPQTQLCWTLKLHPDNLLIT